MSAAEQQQGHIPFCFLNGVFLCRMELKWTTRSKARPIRPEDTMTSDQMQRLRCREIRLLLWCSLTFKSWISRLLKDNICRQQSKAPLRNRAAAPIQHSFLNLKKKQNSQQHEVLLSRILSR